MIPLEIPRQEAPKTDKPLETLASVDKEHREDIGNNYSPIVWKGITRPEYGTMNKINDTENLNRRLKTIAINPTLCQTSSKTSDPLNKRREQHWNPKEREKGVLRDLPKGRGILIPT